MTPLRFCLLALGLLISTSGLAQQPSPASSETMFLNMVSVQGTGQVSLPPDRVSFSVGVQTDGKSITAIMKENDAKVRKMIAALKSRGVKAANIQTSSISIHPVFKDQTRIGYRLSNRVEVSHPEVAVVGELMEAAITAGANDLNGLNFSVANDKAAQGDCLELAFADAKARAIKLVAASGRTLGRVLALSDGAGPAPMPRQSFGVAKMAMESMAVEAGEETLRCTVSASFQID